ncbi:2-dehydropantoate 2-reductase [Metabacillus sediminilitoris]|uniref:2-dehydropantoate 2-reductase n=1 Tax=Metabacillus sediminilitoris TaxID=2567941 RepID=A0A4S4C5K7_9BACI|nr:2-dehydropantoate 2-reductase [Metabacillus sediminilitoris]QGQ46958.1 2-dehydropantoate 2-reductase [Metabacillus sediminilitoris]THF83107.1 2-dehydropantoate 2-reductase [Metabacillus sediminilitoris]
MDFGIIGAGSLGLLYSFYLSKDYSLTLYTNRKQQADLINKRGLSYFKDDTYTTAMIQATSDRNYKEDFLIVTVKQYDIEAIIDVLKELSPRTILFLQNGMGHLPYLSVLSKHQILLGISEHGAIRLNDHSVKHTGIGVTKISHYNQDKPQHSIFSQLLAEQHSLFGIELKDDWHNMLTEKLIVNATINPLTAILKVKNGELIKNNDFKQILYELFKEVVLILDVQNEVKLWEHVQTICKKTEKNESSMYKDIQDGRQTEIDSILGYLIQCARKNQIMIPTITFLYHAIKGIEACRTN